MRQLLEDRVLFGSRPRYRGDVGGGCGGRKGAGLWEAGVGWGRWGVGVGMGVRRRCRLEETAPAVGLDGNNAIPQQLHARCLLVGAEVDYGKYTVEAIGLGREIVPGRDGGCGEVTTPPSQAELALAW